MLMLACELLLQEFHGCLDRHLTEWFCMVKYCKGVTSQVQNLQEARKGAS